MNKSTLLKSLLSGAAALILTSVPAFAQHGGGHAGGGGGVHAGGGGFHGGGGSFHGGGYSGGYHGGYSGGGFSGRGSYAGPRGNSAGPSSSAAAHPWSWEGHSSRDTSPGWHQFSPGSAGRSGAAASASRSLASPAAGRSVTTAMNRPPMADGQWHSFNSPRATVPTAVNRSAFVSTNFAWRGNWGGWRGGWGWRWGWGWPGWNWGWGWGCCGWGFGWGWGWGFGWGGAWGPFWAWPAYWYNPWIYADAPPAPYVLDPYPDVLAVSSVKPESSERILPE